MFKFAVLTALRKLRKDKLYAFISISSLTVGLAGFLILFLYLRSELTYDQHHVNHEQIYRIIARTTLAGGMGAAEGPGTGYGVGPLLTRDYPELGTFTRFYASPETSFAHGNNRFAWSDVFVVDNNVFDVFTHHIIAGDAQTALTDPHAIAISETFARRYFGNEPAVGKIITGDGYDYRVSLVFADLPENTHLRYDALLPFSLLDVMTPGFSEQQMRSIWTSSYMTYLFVDPRFDPSGFGVISDEFYETHMAPSVGPGVESFRMELQPLADVHFGEAFMWGRPVGNIFYVYGFAAVASFLLLIAGINYVNLAVAQAFSRAREVGVRKVLGASRTQLIAQFLGESLIFSMLATFLGIALTVCVLEFGVLDSLLGKAELVNELFKPWTLAEVLLIGLLVGLLSGLYPALRLSSAAIKTTLANVPQARGNGLSFGQMLVLVQLAISVGVIACALLMTSQIQYLSSKPLGFETENRISIPLQGTDAIEHIPQMKEELIRSLPITSVTAMANLAGTGNAISIIRVETNDGTTIQQNVAYLAVDQDYVNSLGIEILAGRDFSSDLALNSPVIVNETLARTMSWDNPIGKRIGSGEIIGVVADFHYQALNSPIEPMALWLFNDNFRSLSPMQRAAITRNLVIDLGDADLLTTINGIEEILRGFDPALIFEPVFVDERLAQQYENESNLSALIMIFSVISIAVSMMGLYGVVTYVIQQRSKEIGIRRVVGASTLQIAGMLSGNLILVIAIAALPASLISYVVIDQWLSRFAYRVDINVIYFVLAFGVVTVLTMATVMFKAIKATGSNPVNALRYE